MENDKMRRAVRDAFDAGFAHVDARPSQKTRILYRIEREVNVKRRVTRRYALALAMVLALALCGGVIAAELGIFGQFGLVSELSGARLARLDEAAYTAGEMVESPEGFSLTLEQAYCDGERLYFAYSLMGEGVVLGDGASLADGTNLTIWDRGEEMDDSGVIRGFQEVELPEAAKPGEALSVVLTVICENSDGSHRFVDVPFSVTLAEREKRTGSASFDEYSAQAELYITDVEIYGEVDVVGPEMWVDLFMNRTDAEVDYVVDYQLIADGEALTNKDYTYGEANGGYGVPVRYDLPESYESLVLRPVRYWSGECEAEDIVLR